MPCCIDQPWTDIVVESQVHTTSEHEEGQPLVGPRLFEDDILRNLEQNERYEKDHGGYVDLRSMHVKFFGQALNQCIADCMPRRK